MIVELKLRTLTYFQLRFRYLLLVKCELIKANFTSQLFISVDLIDLDVPSVTSP